jgi:hypothetical protein
LHSTSVTGSLGTKRNLGVRSLVLLGPLIANDGTVHAVSVGADAFGRGVGVVSEKSATLLFVSSPDSSSVGQPSSLGLPAGHVGDRLGSHGCAGGAEELE